VIILCQSCPSRTWDQSCVTGEPTGGAGRVARVLESFCDHSVIHKHFHSVIKILLYVFGTVIDNLNQWYLT
jgi:hypothetical protein